MLLRLLPPARSVVCTLHARGTRSWGPPRAGNRACPTVVRTRVKIATPRRKRANLGELLLTKGLQSISGGARKVRGAPAAPNREPVHATGGDGSRVGSTELNPAKALDLTPDGRGRLRTESGTGSTAITSAATWYAPRQTVHHQCPPPPPPFVEPSKCGTVELIGMPLRPSSGHVWSSVPSFGKGRGPAPQARLDGPTDGPSGVHWLGPPSPPPRPLVRTDTAA